MYCPDCGKEVNREFKFCPHCGFSLQQVLASIVSQRLEEKEVHVDPETDSLVKQFGKIETRAKIYQNAKLRLREIGQARGYYPVREYFFKETPQAPLRKIDIVWKSTNSFEAAFNIKSKSWRLEHADDLDQVSRLASFNATKKYIVNVSKKTGAAFFIQVTDDLMKTLGLLATTVSSNQIPSEAHYKTYSVNSVRQEYKRAYEGWTEQEDKQLSEEYCNGLTVSDIADKHQRQKGAIYSRLKKLGLKDQEDCDDVEHCVSLAKVTENESFPYLVNSSFTLLVKSEKYTGVCIACLDEGKRWVRPITPGGFANKDLIMDNGKELGIFDVVETKFDCPFPLLHHKENVKFTLGTPLHYVKTLSEKEQILLLSEISNNSLLDHVNSKELLFDELTNNIGQSIMVLGPVPLFHIQYRVGDNHPRIWFFRQSERLFSLSCTDERFCKFVRNKLCKIISPEGIVSSQDIDELKDKQVFAVIGLTGDSLEINNVIKDGKWHGRYWPLVVSVLTIPNYNNEE